MSTKKQIVIFETVEGYYNTCEGCAFEHFTTCHKWASDECEGNGNPLTIWAIKEVEDHEDAS